MKYVIFIFLFALLLTNKGFSQSEWGDWKRINQCHSGIDYQIKKGKRSSISGKTEWKIRFRNRYFKEVWFDYNLVPYSERNKKHASAGLNNIKATTNESLSRTFYLTENFSVVTLIWNVRLGGMLASHKECDK